jgi:hypothetical protein
MFLSIHPYKCGFFTSMHHVFIHTSIHALCFHMVFNNL